MDFITKNYRDLSVNSIDNFKSYYSIILENKEGDNKEIRIFNNSDPLELAFNFCKENDLDCNYMKFLRTIIQKLKTRLSLINCLDENSQKEAAKGKFYQFEDKIQKNKKKLSQLEIIPEDFKNTFNKIKQIDNKLIKNNETDDNYKNKSVYEKNNRKQKIKEFVPNKLIENMNQKFCEKILNIKNDADNIKSQCLILKLMNDKKNNQNSYEKIQKSINSNKHDTFYKSNNSKTSNSVFSTSNNKSNFCEIKTKTIPKKKLNSTFSRNKNLKLLNNELSNISQQYQESMNSVDDKIYNLTEYIINKYRGKNNCNNYHRFQITNHKKKQNKKINFDYGSKIINKFIQQKSGNLTEKNADIKKNSPEFFSSIYSDKDYQLTKYRTYKNGIFSNLITKNEHKLSFVTSKPKFSKTKKRIKQYSYQKLPSNTKYTIINKKKVKPISIKNDNIYKKITVQIKKDNSNINNSSNYSNIELSITDKIPKNQIHTKLKNHECIKKTKVIKENKKNYISILNNNKNIPKKIHNKLNGNCDIYSKSFLNYTNSSSEDDTLKHKAKKIFNSKIKDCQKKYENNSINNGSSFIKKNRKISPFNFPNINNNNKFIKSSNSLIRTKKKENSIINRKKINNTMS